MYVKAKGRIITPKHHALSTTVRHMAGSSQLIQILNGLGHSTSHGITLEHDTALARYQLEIFLFLKELKIATSQLFFGTTFTLVKKHFEEKEPLTVQYSTI